MPIHQRNMQLTHTQQPPLQRFQLATAQLGAVQKLYQRKEDPLKLAEQLQEVMGMVHEIRREVLTQELTSVLHNEVLPAETRKEKVVKIFQLLA
jgi:DNA-binding FrmR family transcriptional regulator